MINKHAPFLPGEKENLAVVFGQAARPLFPGGNVRQNHLTNLLLMMIVNYPSLYIHSHRVRLLTRHLISDLHLSQGEATVIELAALLHDVGKLVISSATLQKSSQLTHREMMRIRRHPAYGSEILKQLGMLPQVTHIVYHHHEHWNGAGYPAGIQGEEIPLGSRIVAIADAFEAMTSRRPYQASRSILQALEELRCCAGTQFDPVLVNRFCSSLEVVPSHSPLISALTQH